MMKSLKTLVSLLLAAAVCLSCIPAFADSEEKYTDEYFADKSWEDIISDFIEEHSTFKSQVSFGYKNLVTGEEHYYNGDKYMTSASVYKLPLNMLYASRIASGELDWSSTVRGYALDYAMENSVVWSNNDLSVALWQNLGNFKEYREAIAPFVCCSPDELEPVFYQDNYFTAEQIIFCLSELYSGGDEAYPRILEFMLRATPDRFFKSHPHEVEVAHKYGYLESTNGHTYVNDCGIVLTDEPFALVVFTDNINRPADVVADYCDLMIAYTEYQGSLCKIPEAQTADEAGNGGGN